MELTQIEARDLSDAWFQCLKAALEKGITYTITRGSFMHQQRKEIDFITLRIKNPGSRPLVPDVPLGVPPPSTQEYIDEYLPYLMTSSKKANEEYTYGEYLEPQISEVIKMYKTGGYGTNQACMNIGGKESIYQKDPPCLRMIDTRTRNKTLNFIVYFRSWDLWAGFPSNLGGIQIMKEYMANEIGVEDGEIIACSKGLHLYDYQWELAKQVVYR